MEALFTSQFFWQFLIGAFTGGGAYMAVRLDLKHMHEKIDEEKRLREEHAKEDDESFHDIRDHLQGIHGRVSLLEGRMEER